jgi:hypothetical protein
MGTEAMLPLFAAMMLHLARHQTQGVELSWNMEMIPT